MKKMKRKEREKLEEAFRVTGGKVRLKDFDTAWHGTKKLHLDEEELKDRAKEFVEARLEELAEAQELLYANDVHSVLIVLQAMDAAGKDGLIKHVMSGVNPQGCQVFSFKKPSDEDLDHNFLWRYSKCLPERGRIGIFNRSYYEEVLVVKVHPEILAKQRLPAGKRDKDFWRERYEDINAFERHLVRNGTVILKFFLNVSKEEQKKRFLSRLEEKEKNWKFSTADVEERGFWKDYQEAFEDMLNETSTKWAPWHVIPADFKWGARALVSQIIASAVMDLHLEPPKVSDEKRKALKAAKASLEKE
jgi:PPK2 family polyphosphate:nucleotide phosphotransferase